MHSAHHTDQNLFGCCFQVFMWNGLWSAFTRKWYITGVTFQEESRTAFIWVVNVGLCLFLTVKMHLKVSSMPPHRPFRHSTKIHLSVWLFSLPIISYISFFILHSLLAFLLLCIIILSLWLCFIKEVAQYTLKIHNLKSEVWCWCCSLLPCDRVSHRKLVRGGGK